MFEKNKNSLLKKGFSIVELLIAISIIMIMTGVLLVNQNNNKAQKDVEVSARQVAAQLRALQNEALNGKRIEDKISHLFVPICRFVFTSAKDSTEYFLSYRNCPSGDQQVGDSQPIELNSGKKNVIFSANDVTISFIAPWGGVSESKITLASKNDPTKQASVCVCSSGNIYEQNNASDCDGC